MPKVPEGPAPLPPSAKKCCNPQCKTVTLPKGTVYRGLCMKCYSQAKKLVEKGETSWEELAEMGMCETPADPTDFASVFRAKKQQQVCPVCNDSGYQVHPENGRVRGVRCPRGCRVNCSICNDPNCDNPGGQH